MVDKERVNFEKWIESMIAPYEGVHGVRVSFRGHISVSVDFYLSTKENAMACYRAIEAVVGADEPEWQCDDLSVSLLMPPGMAHG